MRQRYVLGAIGVVSVVLGLIAFLVVQQSPQASQEPPSRAVQPMVMSSMPTETPSPVPSVTLSSPVLPVAHFPLDTLFSYHSPDESEKTSSAQEYKLIATGDVMPGRTVGTKMVQLNDFTYPLRNLRRMFQSADAVFINLEAPITSPCAPTTTGMVFCGDDRFVPAMKEVGITIANIANNHTGNHGRAGVDHTVSQLQKNNIAVVGNNTASIVTIKDKRFGFLGYNDIGPEEYGIGSAKSDTLAQDIQRLKTRVDFVVVQFHWGVEYTLDPTQRQIFLGHEAVDSGADLVIGNHPHWVQGVEEYKGKLITYAHGNLVFDQTWSQTTMEGVVGEYTFNTAGLASVRYYPIITTKSLQTRFATESEAKTILRRMQESTKALKSLQ